MVQQNPPLSRERQLALTRLVNGILQSGRLFHPQRSQFSAAIYQDIYDEVLQELLLYICQNIHKYEPERGSVMTWVNILLSQRFFKQVVQKRFRQQRVPKMTVTNLYHLAQPESEPHLTEILKKYIDSDPEHLFKQKHIANYPAVNFQALVQRRISGKSWKNISAEFGINISTVSTFYYRCIRKFSSKLKEYCINHVI
ncbi:MAG: sigma-70 family RNA polymerase sigma factor [Iphinoe sp. HA4291-MV1]|nr:sigma-70 family RNA polymerase sigma factor [Iphinoe sp. HA4291-MV1]